MVPLVLSKLDYGNALLYGLSLDQLHKFQNIQNHTTRVIFKKNEKYPCHVLTKITVLVTHERKKNRL